MRVALIDGGILAGVHEADLVAQVVHIALVVVHKDNIAMLLLERVVRKVDQTLGLAAALVAKNYLNHAYFTPCQ